MTRHPPAVFWPLLVLGPVQAALAASVLTDCGWVWAVAAGAYLAGLVRLARSPLATAGGLILLGYVLPLLVYAAAYTAQTLPGRPEAAEARGLLQPPETAPPPPPPSDVPAPRLTPPKGNGGAARGVWLLLSTAFYLAACGVGGLFWHTPVVVYLAAGVAAVLAARPPEGHP
jgi:hypothetical protein